MQRLVVGLVASVLVLVGLTACKSGNATDSLVVMTEAGRVQGLTANGIRSWRGIPYAQPPVDELRWEPPQPVKKWDRTREATQYSDACTQRKKEPLDAEGNGTLAPSSSEDCLYLNVDAPARGSDHPVMVWIHGGGFVAGSGAIAAPEMVERGVVLVSINYRLGRFGFFAHPALGGEVANYGFLDQIAALKWVRENIDGFGGDPDNVTVFGQSAGAVSVNALMTSPAAEGLFDKAIAQSGLGREPALPMEQVAAQNAQALPVASAEELRSLDATELLTPDLNILYGQVPIVDEVMPRRIAEAFDAGVEAQVPYLVGTTDLEFPDSWLQMLGESPEGMRSALIGDEDAAFLEAYGSQEEIDLHTVSDAIFTEPARALAVDHAAAAPTYRYRFSIATDQVKQQVGGAVHTAESGFVFDSGVDPSYAELADLVSDYWVSFARSGDPDHDGAPHWPEAEGGALMLLTNGGPVAADTDPWADRLDVIEAANERISRPLPRISP